MANNDNGGNAFPQHPGINPTDPQWAASRGASLWDFYAAHALPAVIAATSAGQHHPTMLEGEKSMHPALCRDAAAIADAMLAERKKRWP